MRARILFAEQTRRYLDAARLHGMRLRVHCDEMAYGGAAAMAAQLDVDAVDHCNYIREEDVRTIAEHGIVTVACPATIEFLDLPQRAPVRSLLEAGAMVALASDYNPGTSPCFNLQSVAYFGRKLFGLSAAEALYAVTRAAAHSLRRDAGSLRVGGPADFVALANRFAREFGWEFGGNLAARRREKRRARAMTDELVRCARALVSGETRHDYAFVVRDGRIAASGDFLEVRDMARELEARSFPPDRLVVPGFINGHSHAYQILLRGWADDWPFAKWRSDALYRVVPRLHAGRRLLDLRRRLLGDAGGRNHHGCRVLLPQRRRKRARGGRDSRGARRGHPPDFGAHVDGRELRALGVLRNRRRRRASERSS